jgi:hypothetical protein
MGQLDEAVPDLKKALELNPDLSTCHLLLSRIYIMQGRPQDALPEIELVRYDIWRTILHAVAYYALGRQKEADAAMSYSVVLVIAQPDTPIYASSETSRHRATPLCSDPLKPGC